MLIRKLFYGVLFLARVVRLCYTFTIPYSEINSCERVVFADTIDS